MLSKKNILIFGLFSLLSFSNSLSNTEDNVNKTVVAGESASASSLESIAIGKSSKVDENSPYSIAIGSNASSKNHSSISIGKSAVADGTSTIAIGNGANSNGIAAISLGLSSKAIENAIGIGYASKAEGKYSTSIGTGAKALDFGAITIGGFSTAKQYGISAGYQANSETGAISLGGLSNAKNYSVALGYTSKAIEVNSISIGSLSQATSDAAISIGSSSKASGSNSIAVGYKTKSEGKYSITLGESSQASEENSLALGAFSKSTGKNSISIGTSTESTGLLSISIGSSAKADKNNALAIGRSSISSGDFSTSLGSYARAESEKSISLGYSARSKVINSVALGSYSISNRTVETVGHSIDFEGITSKEQLLEKLGKKEEHDRLKAEAERLETEYKEKLKKYEEDPKNETYKNEKDKAFTAQRDKNKEYRVLINTWVANLGAVSIGNHLTGYTRQLVGLAAGNGDTDAVNVAQLKAVENRVKKLELGNIPRENTLVTGNVTSESLEITNGTNKVIGAEGLKIELKAEDKKKLAEIGTGKIESGESKTVSGNTVYEYFKNMEQSTSKEYIDENDSYISNAVAMANLPVNFQDGKHSHSISASYGNSGKNHAFALGFSGQGKNVIYKASVAINTKAKFTVGAGIGYSFYKEDEMEEKYKSRIDKLEKMIEELKEVIKNK